MKIRICGTGRALPAQRVTAAELDRKHGSGDLVASTGVATRYQCTSETQIDLALAAVESALVDAECSPQDIDLIISGASVPYQPIPATAPLIMHRLGVDDGTAAAFDVNATCLGFLTGLEVAARMITSGAARGAIVVASEVASRALPWDTHPDVAGLFGDGAAAAVIKSTPDGSETAVAALHMRTYPSTYDACGIGAGGTRFDFQKNPTEFTANALFAMNGKDLFRVTTQHFNGFVTDLLSKAGWSHGSVDWIVPHQASPGALDHLVRQTGFSSDRVIRIAEEVGNQVAASIPFAFDVARGDGRIKRGDKVLLLGTSAGVSFGGAALVI